MLHLEFESEIRNSIVKQQAISDDYSVRSYPELKAVVGEFLQADVKELLSSFSLKIEAWMKKNGNMPLLIIEKMGYWAKFYNHLESIANHESKALAALDKFFALDQDEIRKSRCFHHVIETLAENLSCGDIESQKVNYSLKTSYKKIP